MSSAWVTARETTAGRRYRVMYRLGGRESVPRYAGSFRRKQDALARRNWVSGELAAMRVPDVRQLETPSQTVTFATAAKRWQQSRVDVRPATVVQHRVALGRVTDTFNALSVDRIAPADIAGLVATLAGEGKARESIRKTVTAIAMTLDFAGIAPNPARDRIQVKLPREEREEPQPPDAATVEACAGLLTVPYLLAVVTLDWTGARVGELVAATLGDVDEDRHGWLIRSAVSKTRQSRWATLPDDLWQVTLERLPAREDRDPSAPLFDVGTQDRLRVAIGRACRHAGVAAFSPHDLRHRRISLLHRQGVDWATIGQRVGQRNLRTTADVYTHAMVDPREINRSDLLARARIVHTPVHTPAT